MDSDPTPLDYGTPSDLPRRAVFSVGAFLASGAVVAVLLLDLLIVVPRFETIFKDFGTKLPAITELLIDASRVLAEAGRWMALAVLPVVIGFVAPLLAPARDVTDIPANTRRGWRRRSMAFLVMTIAMCAIIGITIVALFMPMISLINVVSK